MKTTMNKLNITIDLDASVNDILDCINAERAKAEAEAGPWVPGDGEEYWFADDGNEPVERQWGNTRYDRPRLAARNVWRTKEDCQWFCDLRELNRPHGPMPERDKEYWRIGGNTIDDYMAFDYEWAISEWLAGLAHVDEAEAKKLAQRRHEFSQRPVPKEAMR